MENSIPARAVHVEAEYSSQQGRVDIKALLCSRNISECYDYTHKS